MSDSVSTITVQHKPWKVPFSPTITNPTVGLYSIFDLCFYESDSKIYTRFGNSTSINSGTGLKLDHDIICYYNGIYNSGAVTVNTSNAGYLTSWATTGFDIGYVAFDKRAYPRTVEISNISTTDSSSYNIYIYDKNAALYPSTVSSLKETAGMIHTPANSQVSVFYRVLDSGVNTIWFNYSAAPFTVGLDSSISLKSGTDIILCDEDTVFTSDLIAKTGYTAYTSLYLNIYSLSIQDLIYRSLIANSSDLYEKYSDYFDKENTYSSSSATLLNSGFLNSILSVSSDSSIAIPSKIKDVLKHTYLWIRCGFFGDYVNPDSFNQDLNQSADVKHKNLMISSIGDYNRYDDLEKVTTATSSYSSEKSNPYLIQTAPSEDILSSQIATATEDNSIKETYTSSSASLTEKIDALNNYTNNDDQTIIGSLWNENLTRGKVSSDTVGSIDHLSSPMYYDPEISKVTLVDANHTPVLVPATGNILTEGRILSPTIDEIWIYFKKLVSGHNSDSTNDTEDNTIDTGLIVNRTPANGKNIQDTRPAEGSTLSFPTSDNNTTVGDPISLSINSDNELYINNWVAPPESFKMAVYTYLQTEALSTEKFISQNNHAIVELTPKNDNTIQEDYSNSNNITHDTYNLNKTPYGPREKPYSLRELEAALQNCKYNINTLMRYLAVNYTVNSALTKKTPDVKNYYIIDETKYVLASGTYKAGTAYYSKSGDTYILKDTSTYSVDSSVADLYTLEYTYKKLDNTAIFDSGLSYFEKTIVDNVDTYTKIDLSANNINGSGLYQFHKDYNGKVDAPNTWFNNNAGTTEVTSDTGASAIFDDNKTAKYKFNVDASIYGSATTLPANQNNYSSSDVYLAADGTWRYIFDHNRVPILKVTY